MFKNNRLVYLWYFLIGGVFLISILRSSTWNYHLIASFDPSRWAHFLAYAMVTAIPVAAWKFRRDVAFCLIPVMVSIALEFMQAHTPEPIAHIHNVSADMYGAVAGILLGLNFRLMRNAAELRENGSADLPRSPTN
jgi:hypothetical protein